MFPNEILELILLQCDTHTVLTFGLASKKWDLIKRVLQEVTPLQLVTWVSDIGVESMGLATHMANYGMVALEDMPVEEYASMPAKTSLPESLRKKLCPDWHISTVRYMLNR